MDTEIALGGGRGATSTAGSRAGDTASAGVVGSGGGGAGNSGWGSTAYGLGTTVQGFNGGSAVGTNSGGGGGAGGPGQSGRSGTNPNNSGNGGMGEVDLSEYLGPSIVRTVGFLVVVAVQLPLIGLGKWQHSSSSKRWWQGWWRKCRLVKKPAW